MCNEATIAKKLGDVTNGFPENTGGVTAISGILGNGTYTFNGTDAGTAIVYGWGGKVSKEPNGGYRVQHISSTIASAPLTLQIVLPLEVVAGTPVTGATPAVNITGTLSKQNYFEDDVPEFDGVTVEGSYVGITAASSAMGGAVAYPGSTPKNDGNAWFDEKYWDMNIARARKPIKLSRLYLDTSSRAGRGED